MLLRYISNMADETDYEIDDTSKRYRVRVPDYVYNCFVKTENFKNRLTISPRQITQTRIPLQAQDASVSENYVGILDGRVLYDLQFMREAKLTINANGLKTYEDPLMYGFTAAANPVNTYAYDMKCAFTSSATPSAGSAYKNNGLGLANPLLPGIFGLTDDWMNKSFASTKCAIGGNGESVVSNLSRNALSIMNRFLDSRDIYNNYSGSKCFDRHQKYTQLTTYSPVPCEKTVAVQQSNAGNIASIITRPYMQRGVCMREINNDKYNALSIKQRGKPFANATYTFSKGTASQNYIASSNSQFKATPATTSLTTIQVAGLPYPANVDTGLSILGSIYAYMFYTNKQNTKAIPINMQNTANGNPAFTDEPNGQTLNIQIVLPTVSCPLYNPLLHVNSRASFSNAVNLSIDLPYSLPGLIKCSDRFTNSANTTNDASSCQVSISNQALVLKQYNLSSFVVANLPMTSTIPYNFMLRSSNVVKQFSQSASSAVIPISSVPRYVIISCLKYSGICPSNISDESRNNLVRLSTVISGRNDCTSTRTVQDLNDMTLKNGLKHWGENWMKLPHVVPSYGNRGVNSDPNPSASNAVLQAPSPFDDGDFVNLGLGNFWILEFGTDIPVENLVAGEKCNETIQYTVNFENQLDEDGMLEIVHIFDSEMTITANTSSVKFDLFSEADVNDAMQSFARKVPHLYANSHNLRGGNFLLPHIVHLARHILPKVLPKIRAVYSYYKDNKDDLHDVGHRVVGHAKTLKDLIAKA